MVVNLERVDAIDQAGLNALTRALATARRLGGTLSLAAARPDLAAVLVEAPVEPRLELHPTVRSACQAARGWRDASLVAMTLALGLGLVLVGQRWPPVAGAADGPSAALPDPLLYSGTKLVELAAAALIGLVVTTVYRRLREDRERHAAIEQAQVLLCVSGALMMIIIGDSLARAFGIVGVAGVIRFRTPVEDPKDVTLLFLLMGLGMACGIGALTLASLGTVFLCGVLVVLDRALSAIDPGAMLVEITAETARVPSAHITAAFARHGVSSALVEWSPGTPTVVRYEAHLPRTVSAGEVGAALVGDGSHGVSDVAWQSMASRRRP
jgi:hypothetical protein